MAEPFNLLSSYARFINIYYFPNTKQNYIALYYIAREGYTAKSVFRLDTQLTESIFRPDIRLNRSCVCRSVSAVL